MTLSNQTNPTYNGTSIPQGQIFFEAHRKFFVGVLLLAMLVIGVMSMRSDSAIVDEVAHIPAGYAYVKFRDFRLNPEHPPLMKVLSGLPLLFMQLRFPSDIPAWNEEANGQWEAGWHFIYHIGNDADTMVFFSRLPILLIALLFGYYIYRWTRELFGTNTALLALFFYALSPNIIAHSHFVTTDLGAAAFIFIALYYFVHFLQAPAWKSLWKAALALALAELAKFSAILLLPFFGLITLLVLLTYPVPDTFLQSITTKLRPFWAKLVSYGIGYVLIVLIGYLIVGIVYAFFVSGTPPEKITQLIEFSLASDNLKSVQGLLRTIADVSFLRPLAHYLLGLVMVFSRVDGGNTTFFVGEVTNQSFRSYFPVSWFIKEPLPIVFLTFLSIIFAFFQYFARMPRRVWQKCKMWLREHLPEATFVLFILLYSYTSVFGNLNLGIRHLFPILPLGYILVAKKTIQFFDDGKKMTSAVLALLLFWYGAGTLAAYPYYVSYFNESIGGASQGYRYVTDSNIDWGQDLKRLASFIRERPEIKKMNVDYFGGGEPRYFLCKRKFDEKGMLVATRDGYDCEDSPFREWHAEWGKDRGNPTGFLAVSVTFLQNDLWYAKLRNDEGYAWLRKLEPVEKIGNSIFVYYVPETNK